MATSFVLRGADVVDGSGAPARRADVRVDGGAIGAVGQVPRESGVPEVDLSGLVLAPGFIDIHTHYDAQVLWDPGLTPSSWHGVTTVVMGNCGFGLAPAQPRHRELILGILELVEDMAPDALAAGVTWDFETFPEYLDLLDRLDKRINVAAFIGHTPVRVDVMGEASMNRPATPEELAAMGHVVADARRAGALGIASSLATNHVGPGGRAVPSYIGAVDELASLIAAMGSGVVEIARGRTPVAELAKCVRPGVTLSWSSLLTSRPGETTGPAELLAQTVALDGEVWPQVSCRPVTIQVALANPVALGTIGAFRKILAVDAGAREVLYRDPDWRAAARAEVADSWRPIWQRAVALVDGVEDPSAGLPLVEYARTSGLDLFDALIELALERG
ncbi:MAG TPA: amidohydrolase family protein, partial [Acidimicrobiales bacterium]|nr:amidohydrolase family protein [Acidimicrobiales bacterium]